MKALYGARFVRFEPLWPICSSAREVSKWTRACDKRLHRLMCYIHHTPDHSLESFVGDDAQHCHVVWYSDADFAGDLVQAKSTSGLYLAVVGPNRFAPINCQLQKADLRRALVNRVRDCGRRARSPHRRPTSLSILGVGDRTAWYRSCTKDRKNYRLPRRSWS